MNFIDYLVKPLLRNNGLWLVKRNGRVTGVDFIGDLRNLVDRPNTLLDIGANVGQSIEFFSNIWPDVTIFSVEPDPRNYRKVLLLNHKNSGGVVNVGFGETNSFLELQQFDMHSLNSFLEPCLSTDSPLRNQIKGSPIRVEVVKPTTDYLRSVFEVSRFDVIKIDTQGYEVPILRGMDIELLRSAKLLVLEANYDTLYDGQSTISDLHALCTTAGFSFVSTYEVTRNGCGGISWATCVYINKNVIAY